MIDKIDGELFRLRLQMETTLLVWVRTSLALMGFGFVVARFGLFLREISSIGHVNLRPHPRLAALSSMSGTTLISIGVIVLVLAAVGHYRNVGRLERGELDRPGRWSMGIIVAVLLAAIGMAMAVYLAAIEIDPGIGDE